MRAAWDDRQGPARDVLQVGELPAPGPAAGEVRVRLRYSGINPGDTKKRRGWQGSAVPYPRVGPTAPAPACSPSTPVCPMAPVGCVVAAVRVA